MNQNRVLAPGEEVVMDSLKEIWDEVMRQLSEELTPTAVSTWFMECEPVEIDGDRFIIQTKSDFKKTIINNRYKSKIQNILSDLFSSDFELVVLVPEELDSYIRSADEIENNNIPAELADYTFENFIVGASNQFAHAAAIAVSENPGKKYNPLFIYGNSGLGKTHLLCAIGHAFYDRDHSMKISYIKGEEFMNRMVKSIKEHNTEEFRNEFRSVDLLLMDDIQFIAGKESTQNEFFHTFNTLYESGKQIVITSDRLPKEMSLLDDRLRTRFESGLMADIQPPDYETRMVIARTKAAQIGLLLPAEGYEYIAGKITSNVRQIEGVIKRITAYKEILGTGVTMEYVIKATEDVISVGPYTPSPSKIIKETANYFSVTEEDIKGQSKLKNIATARHISMYLMRTLTNLSLVDIGKEFEGRHHTTVLSSIRRVEEMIKEEPNIQLTIRDITSNINSI